MLTTKINKERRRKKIAREKEEKIKRRNNQKIEKERRIRRKKRREEETNNYKRRIAGCLPEELLEIREEIKNDPLLDKGKKEKLWIAILNLPFSQRKVLPPNVIEQVKKDLLEELGEEEFRKDMKWLIQDTEQENIKMIKEGVKPP